MDRLSLLAVFLLATLATSCASRAYSTYSYAPPTEKKFANELTTPQPFEKVWDAFVGELAKSFYVINNIEKASRIINVSFSTDQPEDYADCGNSTRTFKMGSEEQTYRYPVAGSNAYKLPGNRAGEYREYQWVGEVYRKAFLEGRINIYVAPESNGTKVSVNCRYILTVSTEGTAKALDNFGNAVSTRVLPSSSSTLTFNTNQLGIGNPSDWGAPVKGQSTGKLEQEILQMVPR